MILDVQPPVMRRLYLYGALEVKFQLQLVEMYLFFVISSCDRIPSSSSLATAIRNRSAESITKITA